MNDNVLADNPNPSGGMAGRTYILSKQVLAHGFRTMLLATVTGTTSQLAGPSVLLQRLSVDDAVPVSATLKLEFEEVNALLDALKQWNEVHRGVLVR